MTCFFTSRGSTHPVGRERDRHYRKIRYILFYLLFSSKEICFGLYTVIYEQTQKTKQTKNNQQMWLTLVNIKETSSPPRKKKYEITNMITTWIAYLDNVHVAELICFDPIFDQSMNVTLISISGMSSFKYFVQFKLYSHYLYTVVHSFLHKYILDIRFLSPQQPINSDSGIIYLVFNQATPNHLCI